jgi:hypothetical protein
MRVNDSRSARQLIALVKLPKPLSAMTDEELDAFADRIFDKIAPATRPQPESAPHTNVDQRENGSDST